MITENTDNGVLPKMQYGSPGIQYMETLLCVCRTKIDLASFKLDDILECPSCGASYKIEPHDGMGIPKLIE